MPLYNYVEKFIHSDILLWRYSTEHVAADAVMIEFFYMEKFYSDKEKTQQKRQSRETKYNTPTKKCPKKYIYI